MRNNYLELTCNALQVLLPFSSTYLCESAFSTLVKSNKLSNVESDLRCALTNTIYQAQNKPACGIQIETKITLNC